MMTLEKLKALADKATPGPWFWGNDELISVCEHIDALDIIIQTGGSFYPPKISDRAFIAASREAIPLLIAEVEALREAFSIVITKSHSWVISQETGFIENPIHASYRALAKQVLVSSKDRLP